MTIRTSRRAMGRGAVIGIAVWATFAAVECWFASVLPWLLSRSSYDQIQITATVAFVGVYVLVGAFIGSLAGLLFKNDEWLIRASVLGCLITLFLVNATLWLRVGSVLVALALSIVAAATIILAWLIGTSPNTAFVSLVLLLPFWISIDVLHEQRKIVRATGSFAALVVVLAVALGFELARKRWKLSPAIARWSSLSIVAITLVGSMLIDGLLPPRFPSGGTRAPFHGRRPNVLLITMDTVRADHVSVYGYGRDTTPNLRAMARTATVFSNAIASSNETLATHASIFTGLYASVHGTHPFSVPGMKGGAPLSRNFATAAEIMRDDGYATFAVIANTYLMKDFLLDRGFDYYDCRPAKIVTRPGQQYLPRFLFYRVNAAIGETAGPVYFRTAADINAEVMRLISSHRGKPFFVVVNYMDAHYPYHAPAPFVYNGVQPASRPVAPASVPALLRPEMDQYDGGIAYIDSQLRELFGFMRQAGLYDSTMIIVTADHGEAFGEHGFWGHGFSVFQPEVHVPLLIKYPKQSAGTTNDLLVSEIDLLPTVLHVIGKLPPYRLPGQNLESAVARTVVSESFPDAWSALWEARGVPAQELATEKAIFSGRFKFIEGNADQRLYDIKSDPDEQIDLLRLSHTPEVAPRLRSELQEWIRANKPREGSAVLKSETIERLRSLGYLR